MRIEASFALITVPQQRFVLWLTQCIGIASKSCSLWEPTDADARVGGGVGRNASPSSAVGIAVVCGSDLVLLLT